MIRRLVAGLALCLVMALPAAAQTNVAVVDLNVVSQMSKVAIDADAQLQALFGAERAELEAVAADLNKQYEELNRSAPVMTEEALNRDAQELQTKAAELDARSQDYTQRLSVIQQTITAQMQEVLTLACQDYALRNNIGLIVDGQAVLFAGSSLDVTSGILEEINRVWEARGSKFNLPN